MPRQPYKRSLSGGGGGGGANLRFPNRSALYKAKFNLLWQKSVGYARTRSPDLWIHRAVLYQYATNKALRSVVYLDGIKRKDCCAIHRFNTAP